MIISPTFDRIICLPFFHLSIFQHEKERKTFRIWHILRYDTLEGIYIKLLSQQANRPRFDILGKVSFRFVLLMGQDNVGSSVLFKFKSYLCVVCLHFNLSLW